MEKYKNRLGIMDEIYSIGEKKHYYKKKLSDINSTVNQKKWAKIRLNQLSKYKTNKLIGEVFLINDYLLGGPPKFPRRVVVVNNKSKNVELLPIYPMKNSIYRFNLKKFDGKHNLDLQPISNYKNNKSNSKLEINDLYEKEYVNGTLNDYLTDEEKIALDIFLK